MLNTYDIIIAPFCVFLLWVCFVALLKKYDAATARIFKKALRFKLFCALIFSLVAALYYGGGDSEMFFYSMKDMRQAIAADDLSLFELLQTEKMDENTALSYYFEQDNTKYPVYGFMRSPSNFLIPKLGVLPAIVFFNSYLALCMVFASFAFWGTIRLYKLFLHYFPGMQREVALATLFLPSVCYWSSGFLKDSICFGSVGFLLYGLFNVFIRKQNIGASLGWIVLSIYFLYTIKVYILLALVPGIGFWLFGQLGAAVRTPSLKKTIIFFSLIIAGAAGYMLVNYLTSDENLSKFSLDNILETSNYSREMYERGGERSKGAYFQITTTNPALLALNGLVATFFRPFPWEISSAIVLFSALEAWIFLTLVLYLFSKKGIVKSFKTIFEHPILILCFSFSIIFAISIGITATNFGSLSRYKIPCLPFFLLFILAGYRLTGLSYPKWMKSILKIGAKKSLTA